MAEAERAILHVDMDAFFASVEQLDHPEWQGKPLLVGHDGPRGVVAAASYESRFFGCRSAQPMAVAKRLCPHAIVAPVRFARYREVSRQVLAIFERHTPLVEPVSVDEAFLDVTASRRLLGSAEQIAGRIKQLVRDRLGLTASVGVAPNKFLAKLASDLEKPDGLTVIRPEQVRTILDPLPIEKIWGVGPKTAARIQGLGVRTIQQLRALDPDVLRRRVGDDEAAHYQRLARGEDDRPVTCDRDAKSIGHEQTFGIDVPDAEAIRAVILEQAEQVGSRLRKHGLRARTVTVKIRFGDFETITRRATLPAPTDTTADLWHAARDLFNAWARSFRPVRLIGVTAGNFAEADGQMELFADAGAQKQRKLDVVLDAIQSKYGSESIRRAGYRRE